MNVCSKCNYNNRNESNFCYNCGFPLNIQLENFKKKNSNVSDSINQMRLLQEYARRQFPNAGPAFNTNNSYKYLNKPRLISNSYPNNMNDFNAINSQDPGINYPALIMELKAKTSKFFKYTNEPKLLLICIFVGLFTFIMSGNIMFSVFNLNQNSLRIVGFNLIEIVALILGLTLAFGTFYIFQPTILALRNSDKKLQIQNYIFRDHRIYQNNGNVKYYILKTDRITRVHYTYYGIPLYTIRKGLTGSQTLKLIEMSDGFVIIGNKHYMKNLFPYIFKK